MATQKAKELTPEEFVRLWQTSATLTDAVKKSGFRLEQLTVRAANYRAKGIPLKRFPRTNRRSLNIAALTKLATELAPPEANGTAK